MSLQVMQRLSTRIQQDSLRKLVALQNSYAQIGKQIEELSAELLKALVEGMEVEPGVHIAEIKTKTRGGKITHQLNVR